MERVRVSYEKEDGCVEFALYEFDDRDEAKNTFHEMAMQLGLCELTAASKVQIGFTGNGEIVGVPVGINTIMNKVAK